MTLFPFTLVFFTVDPNESTVTVNLIVGPLAVVAAAIIVILFALAIFLSVVECAVKRFITVIFFDKTYSMILVVFKIALIS